MEAQIDVFLDQAIDGSTDRSFLDQAIDGDEW
jgi:hypothetical protein